jgi:4-aminobutyrate aminotransferase
MYHALSRGLNFKLTMGNIITLTPALTINRQEMDQALKILDASLKTIWRNYKKPSTRKLG